MDAHHSFYVKTIETHARAFLTLNILAIGRVLVDHRDPPQPWTLYNVSNPQNWWLIM